MVKLLDVFVDNLIDIRNKTNSNSKLNKFSWAGAGAPPEREPKWPPKYEPTQLFSFRNKYAVGLDVFIFRGVCVCSETGQAGT